MDIDIDALTPEQLDRLRQRQSGRINDRIHQADVAAADAFGRLQQAIEDLIEAVKLGASLRSQAT